MEIIGAFVLAGVVGVALGVAIAWSPLHVRNALVPFLVFVNTLPKVAIAPLVPDLDGLRHLSQHADGRVDRLLPGGHQHRRRPEPGRGRHARPRPRLQCAEMEDLRQDPHPQRAALHPERAQDHRDGGRGRRHRRRVRGLAARPGLRHRHHAEQHEHLGGLRGADLDFRRRARALRHRRAVAAHLWAPWAEGID